MSIIVTYPRIDDKITNREQWVYPLVAIAGITIQVPCHVIKSATHLKSVRL